MICAPSVLCMRKGKSRVYDTSEFTDSEQARFVLVRIPKFVFPHFFTFVLFSFHPSCSSSCWNASVMKIAACAHQLPMVGYACIPPFVHALHATIVLIFHTDMLDSLVMVALGDRRPNDVFVIKNKNRHRRGRFMGRPRARAGLGT